ncbi:Uroporphyrinogen decarboxylase [uncultured Defluviicoccus sp.]|uniref:uroporphyrinogen decarboxylase n=1 Tax=metagenome TaxID=256318 RepID=A0A380TM06_9ZZZZ|nr:Uroporphyrinogen decarboxylase [uncultured Defluviicoccus sp.]
METQSASIKPLVAELKGVRQPHPPVWFMRQAGRYLPEYQRLRRGEPDFLRFCATPALTIEAALQPLRRFPLDAAIVFSDILVIPHALGRSVRFVEGEGPVLERLERADEIEALTVGAVADHLQPVFASVRGLKAALASEVSLIGFAGSPWTLAVYMIEGRGGTQGERARAFSYAQPALFGRLIECLSEAIVVSLLGQVQAGADVLQLFDSWAGNLAAEPFRRWVIEPTAAIVRALKAAVPEVPLIGFPRGAGVGYQAYAMETGLDAVSLDASVPLAWAATDLQPRVAVQGNLDNVLLAAGGEAMAAAVERICVALGGGRFVFNLGHGVLPETRPEQVAAVAAQVRGWQRSRP